MMRTETPASISKARDLVNERPAVFGGLYLDHDENMLHIGVVGRPRADNQNQVERLLEQITESDTAPYLKGGRADGVVIHQVKYSHAELAEVVRQVDTKEPWASLSADARVSWGVSERLNTVEIGMKYVTEQLKQAATDAFDEKVKLLIQQEFHHPVSITPFSKDIHIRRVD